ncbi:MAG: hypothetical protein GX785_16045 [Armatimonadetes bacterium]|nr:hypothetical protein [Armatimonadota bacterium]HOM81923.1 hypothetical protein [Armatimonadota bacterium]HPO72892.1 hypothetical protein [Armatimonadota bacterium]
MPLELSNRTWPQRDPVLQGKPETAELVRSAARTFVSEGALVCKEINFNGQMAPLPRESSAITSLAMTDGCVYGATSGEESWLFQYALLPYCEAALPLAPIPDARAVTRSLVAMPGHVLYGGTCDPEGGHLFKATVSGLPGDVIQEWGFPRVSFERLAAPVPGEGILRLVASRDSERLFGLTNQTGTIFAYDLRERQARVLGQVDPIHFFSPVLVEDREGVWYAFGSAGRLMRFSPFMETIEATDLRVECFPGRGPYAKIAAAALDDASRRLYLGDTEGLLSYVDLDEWRVVPLGKPVALGGIDHLVLLPDGRLYGTAGSREGMAHLFVYQPRPGALRDLGVLCATTEKPWYGYRYGDMVATPEGRIVLGEADHLGCLFNYFPPLLAAGNPIE